MVRVIAVASETQRAVLLETTRFADLKIIVSNKPKKVVLNTAANITTEIFQ